MVNRKLEGEIKEVSNSDWNYCMLIPQTTSNLMRGRLSGIGPVNDYTKIYDETFSSSNSLYTILSMCILERYNFTPLFKQRKLEPEFMFRCVCNYDKCNSEANFQNYLSAIVKDNK
uniref:Uncharacterized protein n=1 Tax=Syphacia muris TaxID=451379 RepID=A0A0N5AGD1_9BILA